MAEKIDALLTLDDDYDRRDRPDQETLGDMLRQSCGRYSYPFECRDLNTAGFGDIMWIAGSNGCYSGEIKKAAEVVGGIDKLEDQLSRQIPNCDHPFVLIYGGLILPAPDGNTYVYSQDGNSRVLRDNHPNAIIDVHYKRRYFNQNYLGLRAKFTRFYTEFGIEVYELPTMAALTEQIIALYRVSNTEGRTFDRLIPEKFYVDEATQARRDFMLTLMGIQGAGIGEEVADAIASWMEATVKHTSLASFFYLFDIGQGNGDLRPSLAAQPLRGSLKEGARKRTIGPAKVAQIMKAVGLA